MRQGCCGPVTALCALALTLTLACNDESPSRPPDRGGDRDSAVVDRGPPAEGGTGQPKILDDKHPGWRQPGCDTCHKLPETGHTADQPAQCAECHGGNGACNPNGAFSTKTDHQQGADCTSCHQQKHGFTKAADCAACHFAKAGRLDCPRLPDGGLQKDGGAPPVDSGGKPPQLSAALKHNCYNWPAQEFTTASHAPWITSLKTGDLAVELTLKDTTGKSHTLSQLLAQGPVWLQLGSFT